MNRHSTGSAPLTDVLDRLLDPVEQLIATLESGGVRDEPSTASGPLGPSVPQHGENVLATIAIPEDLARRGGRTLVRFSVLATCKQCDGTGAALDDAQGSCAACDGRGRSQIERRLNVAFPPGVTAGAELRVNGEGNESVAGGIPGDLVLSVMLVKKGRLGRGRLRRPH